MRIDKITLYRFSLPLIRPYHLALGTIEAFDTIVAVAEDGNGELGFGEATILTGYTAETIDDSWAVACALAQRITGLEAGDAVPVIRAEHAATPFTSTAVMTALEMLDGHPLLGVPAATAVPLLAIVNATGEDAIPHEIDARLAQGYGTLKVKVGFDVEADLARVRFIQSHLRGRALIRLDGNQGFKLDDALRFCARLDPAGIELLEQPCPADDWAAAVAVAGAAGGEVVHDLRATGYRRQGEAARNSLAQGAEVGHHAVVLLGAAVCEAEPRHDLIEDQRHPVLAGHLAKTL